MDEGEVYLRAVLWAVLLWLGALAIQRLRAKAGPPSSGRLGREYIKRPEPVLPEFAEWQPTSSSGQ